MTIGSLTVQRLSGRKFTPLLPDLYSGYPVNARPVFDVAVDTCWARSSVAARSAPSGFCPANLLILRYQDCFGRKMGHSRLMSLQLINIL